MKTTRARLFQWQTARAKEVDESLRERALLDLPENINGVVVKQFTLRHLHILFKLQSPFIYGGVRKIEDIGVFLWVVSPHYNQEDRFVVLPRRKLFWRRLKARLRGEPFIIPTVRQVFLAELVLHPRFEHFYRAIDRYLNRVFRDSPPTIKNAKSIAACYAAGVIHQIAKTYGMQAHPGSMIFDQIMDTPLAALFQLLKWIQADQDPKTPQFNPMQDQVTARF
ncbi:MAG: hypothetical protein QOI07_920 [Verrucomicrobiota bacterium]|jgi:hypothetical protein